MSLFLRQITRYAAHKLASDPRTREKASKLALDAVEQAKEIANEEDCAKAAGRALRRVIIQVQVDR